MPLPVWGLSSRSALAFTERRPAIDVGEGDSETERRQRQPLVETGDGALTPIAGAIVGDNLGRLERYGDVVLAIRDAGVDATPPGLIGFGVAPGENLKQHQRIV